MIVLLQTVISADLNNVGKYVINGKAGFEPVLEIPALKGSPKVDWDIYVVEKHPIFDHDLFTWNVSSLASSQVAEHQRSGYEQLFLIPNCDVAWLLRIAYKPMLSCRADCCTTNSEVADVPVKVQVPFYDVLDMKHLAQLLEEDAGWTQDNRSVDLCHYKTWGQCRGKPLAVRMSGSHTFLKTVKIGRELFLANVALRARLLQAESLEREETAVRETTDANLAKVNSGANELAEFRKQQTASDVSLQEMTVELKDIIL